MKLKDLSNYTLIEKKYLAEEEEVILKELKEELKNNRNNIKVIKPNLYDDLIKYLTNDVFILLYPIDKLDDYKYYIKEFQKFFNYNNTAKEKGIYNARTYGNMNNFNIDVKQINLKEGVLDDKN